MRSMGIVTLLSICVTAVHGAPAVDDDREVVIRWNQILQATVFTPGQQPPTVGAQRSYAMMHVAMFDAINAIAQTHVPYASDVRSSRGASMTAAAAQAAHDVLSALYPSRQPIYDEALAADLANIPAGIARQGVLAGAEAARLIIALRTSDGWENTPPAYMLPTTPGNWQPTPPGFSAATFTHLAGVVPFAIASATQFLPPPPPTLTSARYAADFEEARLLGSAGSILRTADQTLVARLFASVGTRTGSLNVWNNVARDAARGHGLGLLETSRLFALLNVAYHDALQTSFVSKFTYGLWRPVTAIRRADEDGNPVTTADPAWTPLLSTPPYPTYAGNAACLSAASAQVLARFFQTNTFAFEVFWEGTPGWTRSYSSFSALAEEHARSRIYGGIHFTFDTQASQAVCTELADFVFDRVLRPR